MGYNYKKIKEELVEKKLADDGLVALCSTGSQTAGLWFGIIGALISASKSKYYAVTKVGEKIALIPYTSKKIDTEAALGYNKSNISKIKIGGAGAYSSIQISTVDGKTQKYSIIQGKKDLQTIVEKMEIPNQ